MRFETLAKDQSKAMDVLKVAQQRITTNIADIANNLTAQNGLSRQRQSLDGVLDVRSMRYLQDMQARARDLMRWSMYNLVMSYRYEYLDDVDEKFFNYDQGGRPAARVGASPAPDAARGVTRTPLTEAEVKGIDDAVMRDVFIAEAKKILELRQHRAGAAMQNAVTVRLSDAQLSAAQDDRPGDLQPRSRHARRDVRLGRRPHRRHHPRDVHDRDDQPGAQRPSGLPALRRARSSSVATCEPGAPTYYYFRAAPGDDPIEWGYSYNHAVTETTSSTTKRLRKDTKDLEADTMLKKLLDPGLRRSAPFPSSSSREYYPGYFSDLTLRLTGGAKGTAAEVTNISALQFSVTYTQKTELTS